VLIEYDEDFHPDTPLCRLRGIIDGDWKLVVWAGFDDGLLIDLHTDPEERHNRWDDPACTRARADLLARLAERLAATDRFDTPRICGA
jgi:arylsulfatase A-like enzyme